MAIAVVPTNVREVAATTTTVTVAWDGPNTQNYEYRLDMGDPVAVGTETWAVFRDLTPGYSYIVEVRAYIDDPEETTEWSEYCLVQALYKPRVWEINWNSPERRFYDGGLDRGVLYPRYGWPAVAWEGLTGVEQAGSEGTDTFYLDGRPYLYLPKIQEFSATLRAYTYPDEFSEMMGVMEVTDGMYVDSQMSAMFDLSYRTMVGNAVDGPNHGYKIHLIYNAVVTPQSIAYESFANEVNPVEFSWLINAVPVKIPGYRPSAHITLDTRHMEYGAVRAIEDILYGSTEDGQGGGGENGYMARLPTPEEILDILGLAGDLLVYDLEDGTWEVEGSYKNIKVTPDGYFEISGIDSEDLGDGEYTISTTYAYQPQ